MTSAIGSSGAEPDAPVPGPGKPLPAARARQLQRRATAIVALCFLATLGSGFGLLLLYAYGGNTQLEAVLVAICVGGIGAGLVVWSHWLMPTEDLVEERHPLRSDSQSRQEVVAALGEVGRRRFLLTLLGGAFVGLGAALALPLLSLGPSPGRSLFETSWKKGSRFIDAQGNRSTQRTCRPTGRDGLPGGLPGSADWQAVLIHVDAGLLQLAGDAAAWAPEWLHLPTRRSARTRVPGRAVPCRDSLVCPCHQSHVPGPRRRQPVFGPAVRPLPQLPISLQADGTFIALGDFTEPVGPVSGTSGAWRMTTDATDARRSRRWRPPEDARHRAPGRTPSRARAHVPVARHANGRGDPIRSPCARSSRITGRSCWARSRCSASSCWSPTGTFLTFFFVPDAREQMTYTGRTRRCRARCLGRVRFGDAAQLRGSGGAADAPDASLGGADLRGRDRDPSVPGLLHRRVPAAARAQLDHRRGPALLALVEG